MRRTTISRVRAYHAQIADARAFCAAHPTWDSGEWLGILGQRTIRRIASPRCAFRFRRARTERDFAELHARLAALPPLPGPPEGYVYSFSNGTEYDMWMCGNCERCRKAGDPSEAGASRCEIFEAIHDAIDGFFPLGIARRMGYTDGAIGWGACPEREDI